MWGNNNPLTYYAWQTNELCTNSSLVLSLKLAKKAVSKPVSLQISGHSEEREFI